MSLKTFYFLFFFFISKPPNFERFNYDNLQLCHWKLFIFQFSVLKSLNILKLPNFGRFNHDHLQLCHGKHFIFCFFSFQKLPILKDSIMIIFKYVIANFLFSFFYFKISQYFKTSQFWKIQSWSFLTMSLQILWFCFSILKSLNILKLPNFGRGNLDHCWLCL